MLNKYTRDELEIKEINGQKHIVVKKEADLDTISNDLMKDMTLKIRNRIKSNENIMIQIPNKEQIDSLGLTNFNLTNTSKNSIFIYTSPTTTINYIYDFDKIVVKDGKLESSTTFKVKKQGENDVFIHENIIHPSDLIELKSTGKISYKNDSKSVKEGDFIYFENKIIKSKDQNGKTVFIIS